MVSTSARNVGGPWFDSRSRHDRFLYANSVCSIYISGERLQDHWSSGFRIGRKPAGRVPLVAAQTGHKGNVD